VAVFPLPKIVAFPGHALQFHIFEPRYRRMVRDCIDRGVWLGIAQGDLVKKARKGQSLEEFLNSNQELYTPVEVFGAGPLRLLKELPDGRYVIEVTIQERVRALARVQELPYLLVEAKPLPDFRLSSEEEARLIAALKTEIGCIASLRTGLLKHLQAKEYLDDSSLTSLVYSILKWFVIENREGQAILEDDSPAGRAETLLAWMRFFVREASLHADNQSPKSDAPRGRRGASRGEPDAEKALSQPVSPSPKREESSSSRVESLQAPNDQFAQVVHVDFEKRSSRVDVD
jgi:Lon protease-like protein